MAWIWLRPEVHIELWRAESARHQGTIYREMPLTFAGKALDSRLSAKEVHAQTDPAVASARKLLEDLAAKGEPVRGVGDSGALIPTVEQMAEQLTKAGRGSFTDTYRLSIRSGGDWVHSSFSTLVRGSDETIFDNESMPADMTLDRLEAVGALVILVWMVSDIAGLGLADRCRQFVGAYQDFTLAHIDYFRTATGEMLADAKAQMRDQGTG